MFPPKDSGCCNISWAINAPNLQILVPKCHHSYLQGIRGPRLLSSLAESSAGVSKVQDKPRTSCSRKYGVTCQKDIETSRTEWPTASRAACPSFLVTTGIHTSPMTLYLWEGHTAVVGNTKRLEKTTNKWMEEQAESLMDKTTAAFQQAKVPPTLFSAPPPSGIMISPPPPPQISQVLLALVWCNHHLQGALPWCQWWLLFLGWCLWDLLLEWGHLWEATCQWCQGPQWWDLPPIPCWYPLRQMRRGEPLSSSFVISCSTLPDHGAVILGVF